METAAPTGYVLDATPRALSIDGTHLNESFGSIENRRSTGALAWRKVDDAGALLAGSEWLITGPDGSQAVVIDNGENDKDPEAGQLSITRLAWGEYSLQETKAPEGFELSSKTLTATVSGETLAGSFGDVVNTRTPVPSTSESTPAPSTTPPPSGTVPPETTETTAPPTTPTQTASLPVPSGTTGPTRETAPEQGSDNPSTQHRTQSNLASTGAATTGALVVAGALAAAGLVLFGLGKRRRRESRRRH